MHFPQTILTNGTRRYLLIDAFINHFLYPLPLPQYLLLSLRLNRWLITKLLYKCKHGQTVHAVLCWESQCSFYLPPDVPVCQATDSHPHHNTYFLTIQQERLFGSSYPASSTVSLWLRTRSTNVGMILCPRPLLPLPLFCASFHHVARLFVFPSVNPLNFLLSLSEIVTLFCALSLFACWLLLHVGISVLVFQKVLCQLIWQWYWIISSLQHRARSP